MRPDTDQLKAQRSDIVASRILDIDVRTTRIPKKPGLISIPIKRKDDHTAILLEALTGIIEIGKRDTSNPKYDGYFQSAVDAIYQVTGVKYRRP